MTDRKWYTPSGLVARGFARMAHWAQRTKRGDILPFAAMCYGLVELFGVGSLYPLAKAIVPQVLAQILKGKVQQNGGTRIEKGTVPRVRNGS